MFNAGCSISVFSPWPSAFSLSLVTILEVIQRSTDFLAKKGVPSPRLQVEHLLAHLLKMPRMKLYLNFETALAPEQTDAMRLLVQRRGRREPLQYITNSAAFCGLEFAVNSHVLVPRPETELLAERAWTFLNSLKIPASSALDLGTGSGCLAITLAVKVAGSKIQATDISSEALAMAAANATRNQAEVTFRQGDLFGAVPATERFHLIVSNPPYIPSARLATLDPEVRDHEPSLALDGGADGMDFYRRIAAEAGAFLEEDGRLMLELDDDGSEATREILENQMWIVEAIEPDYNQRPRILVARRVER